MDARSLPNRQHVKPGAQTARLQWLRRGSLALGGFIPFCACVLPSRGCLRKNKDMPFTDPPAKVANRLELSDCRDVGLGLIQSLCFISSLLNSRSWPICVWLRCEAWMVWRTTSWHHLKNRASSDSSWGQRQKFLSFAVPGGAANHLRRDVLIKKSSLLPTL